MDPIFVELTVILLIGIVVTGVIRFLKQPLIIGYILTGIIVSPYMFNIVNSEDAITTFAQIGVVLLLFLVGLNLNPKNIKDVGKVATITGVFQILLTSVLGFVVMMLLGFEILTSVYVAVALSFSSTIIIMKLLTDKRELESLYGKISIGVLILQDIVAMFVLMIIATTSRGGDLSIIIIESLLKGFGVLIFIMLVAIYVLPYLTKWIAKSQEYLLMFSIGWALALSTGFFLLNFSMEVGALLAGITLGISPYRHEISSRLRPLRDFFIILFFILLGSQTFFTNITTYILPIIFLSLFVLIAKPLIIMLLLGLQGYSKRTGFLSGQTLAQISEFSLIVLTLGFSLGHVTKEVLSMITIVAIITITSSTYMTMFAAKVYPFLSKKLSIFERKGKKIDDHKNILDHEQYEIILFGYNRIGHDILEGLNKMNKNFLVVDYNPDTISLLSKKGINCKYGDANDLELLNDLNFKDAKMMLSTVPDLDTNLLLVKKANSTNEMIITIVVSHQIDESLELYKAGATYVVMPHFLGGTHTSMMLEKYGTNIDKFLRDRLFHIETLKNKKKLGFEHPPQENYNSF